MFERLGLTPGRQMATLAGVSELTGGLLTATGVADPLGPVAVASTMAVASAVHRKGGPFVAKGGHELPLTNLAFAVVLATARPGHRAGPTLGRLPIAAVVVGGAALGGMALSKLLAPAPPEEAAPSTATGDEQPSTANAD